MKIANKPISALKPYPTNARTHSDAQIAKIAASIREFGWTNPILIDPGGGIIAGHGRLLAAKFLGMTEVPTISLDGLSPDQRRALVLADNRLALDAGWDERLLAMELSELQLSGFDLDLTGFESAEIEQLLAGLDATPDGLIDEDAAPDVQADAISKIGDVWELGKHRLMCGDSTSSNNVGTLLASDIPNLMVTDPPYGVEYDANWRNEVERKNGKPIGARAVGKVLNDGKSDWREAWQLFPGNIAYVWHAGKHASTAQNSLESCGFSIRNQIIWAKSNFCISRGDYHWMHEPCWYAVRDKGNWTGDRSQTTLWKIDKPMKSETGHSTQKPIECMRKPIENNSRPGDSVYDPFVGSGTTIIAAEQTGWQQFTGKRAKLVSTGLEFPI